MKVTFIGHNDIKITDTLVTNIKYTIIKLVNKGVKIFLFGSKSRFNYICLGITNNLKKIYKDIICINVRAEYPIINEAYKNYLLKFYNQTYYPKKICGSGKRAYVERNYIMIDCSSICVFYYDNNYYKEKSGTKIAYEYAIKKHKTIINLFKG